MKRLRQMLAFAAGLVVALAFAPGAEAAPFTLGPPLSPFFSTFECPGGCAVAPLSSQAGSVISPVNGLITSWSVTRASSTPGYSIVTASNSGLNFTGGAASAPQTPATTGVESFATSVPIKAGERVVLNVPFASKYAVAPGGKFTSSTALGAGESKTFSGESSYELGFNATIQPAPTISSVNPAGGPGAGATTVTILGTDFENTTGVRFGSVPAAAFVANSEGAVTATSPAGSGAVTVSVTTIAGTATSPQPFVYAAPPAAGGPAPAGPPAPGPAQVAKCTVPKLRGKSLKSAKKRIRAANCSVGKLTKKEGATPLTGEISKQVPKPGASVPRNTKVNVTLVP